jgi:hypothetical protein
MNSEGPQAGDRREQQPRTLFESLRKRNDYRTHIAEIVQRRREQRARINRVAQAQRDRKLRHS